MSTSLDPLLPPPQMGPPLLLLHVPRTAGFTLKRALEAVYGTRRSLLDAHHYDRSELDPTRYDLVEGHVNASFMRLVGGRDWARNGVTILRDPVARVISQARHIRKLPRHKFHAVLASRVRDPEEIFGAVPHLSNLQTQMLAGMHPRRHRADEATLERATHLLERIAFSTTERFESGLALIVERFDLELGDVRRTNASPPDGDRDLRSEAFRAAAAAHNPFDAELHARAVRLLEERTAAFSDAVLHAGLPEGRPHLWLRVGAETAAGAVRVPADRRRIGVRGWITIDGRPADAVVVRCGSMVTPMIARTFNKEAGRSTRSAANLRAGFQGRIPLPRDADHLEVIAMARRHGVAGRVVLPVRRERIVAPSRAIARDVLARLRRSSSSS